jgi:FkbM family methyltransferase
MSDLETIGIDGSYFKTRNEWDRYILQDEESDIYRVKEKKYKVSIDIGAHIGGTTMMLVKRGSFVYAIEPNSKSFELLYENIRLNNQIKKTKIYHNAIGKEEGNKRLYLNSINEGRASLVDKSLVNEYVDVITLQSILDEIEYCDFIKCDCEGSENEIFLNLPEEYFKKIGEMAIETHFKWENQKKLIDFLSKFYKVEITNNNEVDGDRLIFCIKL